MIKNQKIRSVVGTVILLTGIGMSGIPAIPKDPMAVGAAQVDSHSLRKQKEEVQQKADELKREKGRLKEQLGDLNSDLQKISASLSNLEDEIYENTRTIESTRKELEEAGKQKDSQYQSMKLRIRYMYENKTTGSIMLLLQSRDFADFLNRVTYVAELSGYDRNQLRSYQETVEKIKNTGKQLQEQQAALREKKKKLGKKQEQLRVGIENQQKKLASAENLEEAQKEKLAKLSEQIKAMEKYEKEVEEQKAREAAEAQARAEREKQQEQQKQQEQKKTQENEHKNEKQAPVEHTAGDQELLAAIIYCEAGGSSYECQLAVGTVIMNRVSDSGYPGTLTGVIYQSGQFSPASSGRLAVVLENNLASSGSRKAAQAVLSGTRTGSWLSFCLNTGRVKGQVIGSEVFY